MENDGSFENSSINNNNSNNLLNIFIYVKLFNKF
jgi:hypothetical protein